MQTIDEALGEAGARASEARDLASRLAEASVARATEVADTSVERATEVAEKAGALIAARAEESAEVVGRVGIRRIVLAIALLGLGLVVWRVVASRRAHDEASSAIAADPGDSETPASAAG